jgi:hypothetical protein
MAFDPRRATIIEKPGLRLPSVFALVTYLACVLISILVTS